MYVSAKMIPVETLPGIREGGMGERFGSRREFKINIFDTL
jgi:hypothetical protein